MGELPPFAGVAVKVTLVPAQIVVADAPILTLTGKLGFTVIVVPALVAGFPVAQGVAFEVRITFTTSLFAKVVVVNVLLLLPAFELFTCH